MAVEVGAAQRRIIRRPRLTSMLDDSSARIRLLIAPAGYGKTTLAREWLGEPERQDVWYRGGPASADVAALAAGIAEAASEIVPDAGKRMRDRLRATGHPEEDVDILADLFAEDVQAWPPDAWLTVDDYHFAMDSVASERFVDLLTQQTPIQMLITSRRRPSWATARRILYGEILEIDRRALAMEDAEARALLGHENESTEALIARVRGWPAVLGLAALTAKFVLPADDLPAALHTFFAEELFNAVDPSARRELAVLALAPMVSDELVSFVFGAERSKDIVATGHRLGILTVEKPANLSIHPLLRDFLQGHLSSDLNADAHAERMTEYYLALGQWDYAYEVAYRASLRSVVERTIESGLDPLLSEGRLPTLHRWVESAFAAHIDAPILDLAESELAFRRGEHERAYVLASQAALRLGDSDLSARAHVRAGHSALLASNERVGLDHFRLARTMARSWERRRETLVGLYFAASELDVPDAISALDELEAAEEHTPDGILRLEALRLTRAARGGGVLETLQAALPKLHLADRATDPLGLTAFLHMLATCLNLAARYDDALDVAEHQLKVASEYRLELPVVHAQLNRAISHLGLQNFQRSTRALDEIRRQLPPSGDAYLEGAIRAIACRCLTTRQRFNEAVALTDDQGEMISSPPVRAEYLSCRALALACAGDGQDALALLEEARAIFSRSIELQVFSECVKAITSIQTADGSESAHSKKAWDAARETGNFDSLVCSYRAEPRILATLVGDPACRVEVIQLLTRTRDHVLAQEFGISVKPSSRSGVESLTGREVDVLQELEQGSSNREIAQRLFISEATVKVHLRHIYEKLGVRTRAELLARRR
jgi:LuxR family transcriptional regulator, maltose regulon positive regulatory protein